MTPSIAIVTPWHEHGELAAAYFRAVDQGAPDELIIIDNGSATPLQFADIRLQHNEGFHFASNVGLRTATTDAVLFLNNDIEMEERDWLDRIRAALQPGVLVGACLRTDPHTRVDGEIYPYLDGWCLAGMRDDLLGIGGWDETLEEPAYFGDNILALRARQAGLKLLAIDVGLSHIGSQTSRSLDWAEVAAVTARNRRVYQRMVREANAVLTLS